MTTSKREQIIEMFNQYDILRPRDIEAVGISGIYLNKLYNDGVLDRHGRGLYTLKNADFDQNKTLVEACKKIPNGVVCLLSALQFHELTTELPFEIWIAIDRNAHKPKYDYPPVRIFRFSELALTFGVKEYQINNSKVKVFTPAKTVADCFKYRNKIGIDVAIEALREVWSSKKATMNELYEAAKVCRVHNVMRPYMESLL